MIVEHARAYLVLVSLLAPGCITNPKPQPPPQPPQPPPVTCPDLGVPWCHEAGMSCGQCKHHPPGEPCPVMAPPCGPVDPPPITPPPSECAPTLDPALSAPVAPDIAWPKAADQTIAGEWRAAVWDATARARAACPSAWSGYCMAAGPSAIDYGHLLISKQLQLAGIAASQAVVSGEKKDHLWIRRSPTSNDWNATKLFFYGNGCLITGDGAFTVHGWYTYAGGSAPPPDPPPVGGCSAPLPEQVWTAATIPPGFDSGLIGHTRYVMTCVKHGRDIDCAVQTQRACAYCEAIGMGEAGGQIRCGCPVRNECKPPGDEPQNFKCEERRACEAYLTGGTVLEARPGSGAVCEFAHDNPFMFKPSDGNCRLCGANGTTYEGERQGCGAWF